MYFRHFANSIIELESCSLAPQRFARHREGFQLHSLQLAKLQLSLVLIYYCVSLQGNITSKHITVPCGLHFIGQGTGCLRICASTQQLCICADYTGSTGKKLLKPQKYELLRCHHIAQSHHLITSILQTKASNLHLQNSCDNCACTVSWETKLWLPIIIK